MAMDVNGPKAQNAEYYSMPILSTSLNREAHLESSERKKVENSLKEALKLNSEILEGISDGIFSLDSEWRFTYLNRIAANNVGYEPEELINKNIWELFPSIEDTELGIYMRNVMTERQTASIEYYSGVLTDKCYQCKIYPYSDGITIYWIDVTRHKQTEDKIKRDKQRADLLFAVAGKLLSTDRPQEIIKDICLMVMDFLGCKIFSNYMFDEDRQILHLNAYAGLPEELAENLEWVNLGSRISGIAALNRNMIVEEDIQNSSSDSINFAKEIGIRAIASNPLIMNNKVVGTLTFGTELKNSFSEDELQVMKLVAGMVTIAMDRIGTEQEIRKKDQLMLSAEKEKNIALAKAIEMKDEFIAFISHEFKTPLTVINSAVQALELMCKNELSDKSRRYINMIRQNSNRQLKLINNLLDITRINAGRLKMSKSNIDIIGLTRSIVESIRIYAVNKNINLQFNTSFKQKVIAIDDEKYERILLNLLSNAIKFTPENKSITVKISSNTFNRKNKLCIQVTDEGIGIPEDKRDIIFERFGQVESSLSRQAEGSGIGLSLVKLFVGMLGGEITLESMEGSGSTFSIFLPVIKMKETVTELEKAETCDARLIQATAIEFSDVYLR